MGNNKITNSENILVKVDENNLIYIDPNSVIHSDGTILPRNIEQEKLVMYVNLESDIIPRSILTSENDKNTLTSIAQGTLNFLKNAEGGDYDSTWTDTYLNFDQKTKKDKNGNSLGTGVFYQSDKTGQSFGIDSINISIKGINSIPQVQINFIDVRGKTLFESPENSPYSAFFHIPWPIYYLTIKGFYGKAIKYRLHLVKFNSKYNETNGNFEVETTFVGSTYAWLNDIPLKGMLNAPYMYPNRTDTNSNTNTKTNNSEQKISKSSKGYQILKTVYSEYKQKGLLPKDFPNKTLRELLVVAETLDKILEKQILDQVVSMKLFSGLKSFEDTINGIENNINSWCVQHLTNNFTPKNNVYYYELSAKNKTEPVNISGTTKVKTLENIIESSKKSLNENELFNNSLLNKTNANFKKEKIVAKNLGSLDDYVTKINEQYVVAKDELFKRLFEIRKSFNEQKDILEKKVEEEMNNVIKDTGRGGIGFSPTVRNIFAVILANAEVYVRLMKDVHQRAFDASNERKKLIEGFSDESTGENIYPWPEIKKGASGEKQKVIAYPAEPELQEKLKSNNMSLWPEVEFLENYIGVATNKIDTLSDKENINNNVTFGTNIDESKITKISSLSEVSDFLPYTDKLLSSFLYEIWERSNFYTLIDSFDNETLKELSEIEFENIKESIKEDDDLIALLHNRIKTAEDLRNSLQSFSPFERYPYYKDELPTVPYIKDSLEYPIKIEQYLDKSLETKNLNSFVNLNNFLENYSVESYRKKIYPFTSDLYLSYINKEKYEINKFGKNLKVDLNNGFICSGQNRISWVKSGFTENLFLNKLNIGNSNIHILNTPYFHKQLYNDFITTNQYGKFKGSAYLLLNSLPFRDLEDELGFLTITEGSTATSNINVRMSNLFKEVGASHFVPYHLIVKWGSIYHRYKKYILEGIDILSGFLDNSNNTTNIDGSLFFDDNDGDIFQIGTDYLTYSDNKDTGIHPYYDALYHEIINGYNHYIIASGSTSFNVNVNAGAINERKRKDSTSEINYWTGFVDNSKFDNTDLRYTLLPSDGNNSTIGKKIVTNEQTAKILGVFPNLPYTSNKSFEVEEQSNFRVLWDDDYVNDTFSGKTFPSYDQYHRSFVTGTTRELYDNKYSISENYRKVIDLIGTFSPKILDEFEDMFLQFSSEKGKEESPYKRFEKVNYYQFQDILKGILTVKKTKSDSTNIDELITTIKKRQEENLKDVTTDMLSVDNWIKITIGNPKEIDAYVFKGFSELNVNDEFIPFTYNEYNSSQSTQNNLDLIKLYIGEDIDSYYNEFFITNDVELNETNIIQFRPLILIYAGYRKSGGLSDKKTFQKYIIDNIFLKNNSKNEVSGSVNRLSLFLTILTSKFNDLKYQTTTNNTTIIDGYNNRDTKIELYNYFKSFNDKWIGGNSIGQRLLLEEFLFLDKANKDIGDKVFLNIQRLKSLGDPKNEKTNLYSVISMLIQGTGFDMRPLPAYVNFYGTNFNNQSKITPSKKVAENLFGTFLDVDYQDSSPKIIIQFTGPVSKYPTDMGSKFKYNDDSYYIGDNNNNPMMITTPAVFNTGDLAKSNKVVAFEVSFGDQNQSIFKGLQLNQSSLKNTSESFVVLENIAKSESGAGAYNVDIGLFEYYRQASYSCEVTCMGNVMIQPTMFFYLKNVPMFRGSYWITEVTHNIRNNNITTTFKGSRIPYASLPDPKDSFTSSYRVLFDSIAKKAIAKVNNTDKTVTPTTITINTSSGSYTTDIIKLLNSEKNDMFIKDIGITKYGIPYNGAENEQYIQKIKINNKEWLRASVVRMGGENYPVSDDMDMSLINQLSSYTVKPKNLKWSEIKNTDYLFYSTKFKLSKKVTADIIMGPTVKTEFYNPQNKKSLMLESKYLLDTDTSPKRKVQGPINIGPTVTNYGMGMSPALMEKLKLFEGDIVYFNII
jgi:hypothetical protein